MSLIYITGVSGTGKSTVRKELQNRGFEAHDTDDNGFRGWFNPETKQFIDSDIGYNEADREWLDKYPLYIKRDMVEKIVPADPSEKVFLCGSVPNANEVWDLFDEVIYLIISEDVLRERIANRTNNRYGKDPAELEAVLGWRANSEQEAQRFGAKMVDATCKIDEVVNEIIGEN